MDTKDRNKLLFWAARFYGAIIAFALLFFVFGHAFWGGIGAFQSTKEIAGFIGFPILTLIGLLSAQFFPRTGGIITLMGMGLLYAMMPDTILNVYFGSATLAGLLFVIAGIRNRPTSSSDGYRLSENF
ncbi:MAG: hypothetical protein AAFW89_04800 [Bacteroidota bacterium]